MEEIWKDIPGYEGMYQVSNLGQVRSLNYGRTGKIKLLKQHYDIHGYLKVGLAKHRECKYYFVHRLVAICFIENPLNYPIINHKDENPSNNIVDNLEWCDHKYNINYGSRNEKVAEKLRKHEEKWRAVNCYNLYGKFIKHYKSIISTKGDGFNPKAVLHCCRGRHQTHHGYRFEYA